MIIKGYFSIVIHKKICCGYSLESHRRGDSKILMSTYKICFCGEIMKIISKLSSSTILNYVTDCPV